MSINSISGADRVMAIRAQILERNAALQKAAQVGGNSVPPGLTLRDATRRYVEATLAACGGNRTEAARRLGIGRNTIGRLLKER